MNTYNVPKKVNVPELFYKRFLENIPVANTMIDASPRNTLLAKLASVTPTRRGQGMTRWLFEDNAVTEAEWNALYELAADGRAKMQGADRETTLRPAICARALADRMEKIGVDTPIPYTPKFRATRKPKVVETTEEDKILDSTEDDTDLSSRIPATPPTVDQTAEVDEVDADDLGYFNGELANS